MEEGGHRGGGGGGEEGGEGRVENIELKPVSCHVNFACVNQLLPRVTKIKVKTSKLSLILTENCP